MLIVVVRSAFYAEHAAAGDGHHEAKSCGGRA